MNKLTANAKLFTLCSTAILSLGAYAATIPLTGAVAYASTTSTSTTSISKLQAAATEASAVAKEAATKATAAKVAANKAKRYAAAHPKSKAAAKTAAQKAALAKADAKKAATLEAAAKTATEKLAAAQAQAQAAAKAQAQASTQKYKDGTYTGVGQTRIGAVQVQITLKADKITDVQITGSSTHYPISYIDPVLPQELMQTQDVNQIQVVSGATLSTEDFYYAVESCLQQASQAQSQAQGQG